MTQWDEVFCKVKNPRPLPKEFEFKPVGASLRGPTPKTEQERLALVKLIDDFGDDYWFEYEWMAEEIVVD